MKSITTIHITNATSNEKECLKKQILLVQREIIFAENNTYENGINREHKLNIDTVMNLKTTEKIFITTPKKVCRATILALRPQKYESQSNPYSPLRWLYL